MATQALATIIYFSHGKIGRLFRQLPESRQLALTQSCSENTHGDLDQHATPPENKKLCLTVSHAGQSISRSRSTEAVFDKNDMYQLRQVLRQLRRAGQLPRGFYATLRPGQYCEVEGNFRVAPDAAPPGYVWLVEDKGSIRLLCHKEAFLGESNTAGLEEYFSCSGTLPLRGVMHCLCRQGDIFSGVPLFLAISS